MSTEENLVKSKQRVVVGFELDFDQMCGKIHSAWYVTRNKGLAQEQVWNQLTAWIHEHTKVDEYAAGIVLTFMIQICEVFAPSKAAAL